MLTSRIIPCLDIRGGRIVKGIRFQNLRDAGDPVEQASSYAADGADEIVVLDVSATIEERMASLGVVRSLRKALNIPITVGGGIRSCSDAQTLLEAGADKVAVNSAAALRPALIDELSMAFGRQCIVISVDAARLSDTRWSVMIRGGRERTERFAIPWLKEAEQRGAGEILLTSWDRDGTRSGYDLQLLHACAQTVRIPIIASGGADSPAHMADALNIGASAVLAASIFHDNDTTCRQVKTALQEVGIEVRL
ncbi:MAG: imidazole glycerol phosphate synthase subunit HisF [Myxococcota bacterium]|nr:imidazole glycerol phosphate synthase subunit HisF [Myxococcota bacterium]